MPISARDLERARNAGCSHKVLQKDAKVVTVNLKSGASTDPESIQGTSFEPGSGLHACRVSILENPTGDFKHHQVEVTCLPRDVFFLNCAVHAPAMYGAVEAGAALKFAGKPFNYDGCFNSWCRTLQVFSKSALGAYKAAHWRCEGALPFWSWGEDRRLVFGLHSMKLCQVLARVPEDAWSLLAKQMSSVNLKKTDPDEVAPVADYNNNVRDARCWGSDCGNKGAVAFHAPLATEELPCCLLPWDEMQGTRL